MHIGGVIEVATQNELPSAGDVHTNAVYFIAEGNILAKSNGTDWVQVNPNTGINQVQVNGEGNAVTGVAYDTATKTLLVTKEENFALHSELEDLRSNIPEYTIIKTDSTDYAAVYQLTKNGQAVGEAINIPKDLVIKSGSLETVIIADHPYVGAQVGDPYLEIQLNGEDADPIYIPVKGLVDVYTQGQGIAITNNEISLAIAENNGLEFIDGKLNLAAATRDTQGALTAIDKTFLDSIPTSFVPKRYAITNGLLKDTLVKYNDNEIRVMFTKDSTFIQQSGGGDADKYYIGFRAYAPEEAVSFKEDLATEITDETMYYFEGNSFAGVDEFGRKYSIVWLPVAAKQPDGSWKYYGATSSTDTKYIGWHYSVEWYNAQGVCIDADCIRINLTNEECHTNPLPAYMTNYATPEDLAGLEERIAAVETMLIWDEI